MTQQQAIDEIIIGNETAILTEMLDKFLSDGLGSLTKKEMDIYLFYLLEKHQANNGKFKRWSNYQWSSLLKIPESRIKTLRLESGIRFGADSPDYEQDMWQEFCDVVFSGFIDVDEKSNKLTVTIENPLLLRFVSHVLKANQMPAADYSFNPEKITLSKVAFTELMKKAGEQIGSDELAEKLNGKNSAIEIDLFWKKAGTFTKEILIEALKEYAKTVPKLLLL